VGGYQISAIRYREAKRRGLRVEEYKGERVQNVREKTQNSQRKKGEEGPRGLHVRAHPSLNNAKDEAPSSSRVWWRNGRLFWGMEVFFVISC
jgi:hypothetical protein